MKLWERVPIQERQFRNSGKTDLESQYRKGLELYNSKNYTESIQVFNRIIKINPKDYVAYNNKAVGLSALQKYRQAISVFDQSIKLNSQSEHSYNGKGILKLYHEFDNFFS